MKKIHVFLMAALLTFCGAKMMASFLSLTGMGSGDKVSLPSIGVEAGQTFTVPVSLENTNTNYVAFQMDIEIPQGVTPIYDEDGFVDIVKTSRLTGSHDFSATYDAESNTIKLLCSSMKNLKIKESTGELFSISLQADAYMKSGDYRITCKNITFSTSTAAEGGAVSYSLDDTFATLQVTGNDTPEPPVITDIDVTTALDIISKLDAGATTEQTYNIRGVVTSIKEISTVYGNTIFYMASPDAPDKTLYVYRAKGFNNEAITDENLIQVGDEVVIFAQLQNYRGNTPEAINGYFLSIVHPEEPILDINMISVPAQMSIDAGSTFTLPISLLNSNSNFVAFQMDIVVPQGVTPIFDEDGFVAIEKTSRLTGSHDFSATYDAESSTIKILCSSMKNLTIKESTGELFYISLQANASMWSGNYQITCKNVIFSTSTAAEGGAVSYTLDDATTNITVTGYDIPQDINVSTALQIISKLDNKAYTNEYYNIHGVISSISSFDTKYGTATFNISNAYGQELVVYRAYGLNGEKITDSNLIQVGDSVVVYAQLQNYNGTPETRQNGHLVSIVRNETWTIVGSEEVFGSAWDTSDTNNDMTEIGSGVFRLTKENVRLVAGQPYEFKVVKNHSWDENYGANGEYYGPNVEFYVPANSYYNLYFYFYRNDGNQLGWSYEPITFGIEPNPTEVVVYGQERDDLSDTENEDGSITIREEEGGTGEVWDNQFYIVANRALNAGEEVVVEFDYMASTYATVGIEFHAEPSEFLLWNPFGDLYFTPEWRHFAASFTVPQEADGMKTIAFDMAQLKAACDYHIKNVVWRLAYEEGSLINQEGSENFFIRIGSDNDPYMFDDSAEGMFALLTAQIEAAKAAIANLTYKNVPGVSTVDSYIKVAETLTIESEAFKIKNAFEELRKATIDIQNCDRMYKYLAELMDRVEVLMQKNPEADATLVAEATAQILTARKALQDGSYQEYEVADMIEIMNDYYTEFSKVYLTVNLTDNDRLSTLINNSGFAPSGILGLTITGGPLWWEDADYMRQYMPNLEKLDMSEANVEEISNWLLYGLPKLNTVVLPNKLQRIGYYAFGYNQNLKSITCKGLVPPELNDYLIADYLDTQCMLYVPSIAVNAYKSASYWSNFKIVGVDELLSDIFITTAFTLDWPEGIGTNVKPNVTISNSQNNQEQFGSLTLNGNSTMSMSSFNIMWDPYRSSWGSYNEQTGTYDWNRSMYSSLLANAPMRADNVAVTLNTSAFRWDFVTFPFDVKVSDIVNLTQTNAPLVIRRYDGKNRADGKMGETWVDMTPDMTLEAGKGYIWQSAYGDEGYYENNFLVTAVDNAKKNNIFTTNDVTVQLNEYVSEFSQNRSWNLIGNPYPAFYDIRGMQTTAPITVWNGYKNVYEAFTPGDDSFILPPGQAFFIQRPLDQEALTFLKEGRQTNLVVRNKVGNRAAANQDRYVFNLILSGSEEGLGDRTRIVFDATAKADYEAGCDASKFMSPEATAAQIFTTVGDLRYAINVRPAMDGLVELGLSIGTAGNYIIALNTTVENEVYLIDRETGNETRIDGGSTYTFNATKGIIEGRFAVRFGNGEVTGIKAIANDSKADDNWYNLKGQRVSAPQKGLYIQNGKKAIVK